ncbi:MAG: hypothetical protein U0796_22150 [Gemmatales bacterium]
MSIELFTLGDIARRYRVQLWQVRRLYERGYLPEPATRLGGARIVTADDLPTIKAALKRAGYTPGSRCKLLMVK